jgi:hypothetical protein
MRTNEGELIRMNTRSESISYSLCSVGISKPGVARLLGLLGLNMKSHALLILAFRLQPFAFAQLLTITTQPRPRTNLLGGRANFSTMAQGTAPLSYQWIREGALIADATNDVLILRPLHSLRFYRAGFVP